MLPARGEKAVHTVSSCVASRVSSVYRREGYATVSDSYTMNASTWCQPVPLSFGCFSKMFVFQQMMSSPMRLRSLWTIFGWAMCSDSVLQSRWRS
ncbi:hypothetical protein [Phytohabitans suffuscus]|uniref:hypothetical protein n=1 Tax=Phytohabitans suffuscus TaxID=624315 RepID=UPI001565DA7D|nr:hypothetical protein [Phytohabitans suffuscus]